MKYLLLFTIVLFIYLILYARHCEKKNWNNGKCICGNKWKYFDTDSQGGRGYICNECDKIIWISYNVDK